MRDGNHVITVGFAISVVVACLMFVTGWWLSERHVQYDKQADYYAAEHASRTPEELLGACRDQTGLQLVECLSGQIEAKREAKRGEGDLAAQQQMAFSTLGMLLVSAVALAATIVGVIFVWLTLRETRRIGNLQTRAYVNVFVAFVKFSGERNVTIRGEIGLRNSGQSPAKHIKTRIRGILSDRHLSHTEIESRARSEARVGGDIGAGGGKYTLVTEDIMYPYSSHETIAKRQAFFYAIGSVEYETLGKIEITSFQLMAMWDDSRQRFALAPMGKGNIAS